MGKNKNYLLQKRGQGGGTNRIKVPVIDVQAFGVRYLQGICPSGVLSGGGEYKLGAVVRRALCDGIRQASRWIPSTVQYIGKSVADFLTGKPSPYDLRGAHSDYMRENSWKKILQQ